LFQTDDAKFHVPAIYGDPVHESCPTLSAPSVKIESETGNSALRFETQEPRRTSLRPPRRAAEKVQSYKEIPLNVKMRRSEWVENLSSNLSVPSNLCGRKFSTSCPFLGPLYVVVWKKSLSDSRWPCKFSSYCTFFIMIPCWWLGSAQNQSRFSSSIWVVVEHKQHACVQFYISFPLGKRDHIELASKWTCCICPASFYLRII